MYSQHLKPVYFARVTDHGGHIAPSATREAPDGARGGAATEMLLGWLLWLRAWLSGDELATVTRGGTAPHVGAGTAYIALPEGWCEVSGIGESFRAHRRRSFSNMVARNALADWLGSQKLAFQRWRRVFRVFVDFGRTARGDIALPAAHHPSPEGGCGPPRPRAADIFVRDVAAPPAAV